MITTDKLRAFSEILNQCKIELDELLRKRQQEKLFENSQDYYVSLKSCEYCPQEFYKLRVFDGIIELRFNQRIKKYYLHIDSLKYQFFREITFNEFISKYKIKTDTFQKNWYIPQTYKFDEVIKIFSEFCIMYLKLYNAEEQLFIYK